MQIKKILIKYILPSITIIILIFLLIFIYLCLKNKSHYVLLEKTIVRMEKSNDNDGVTMPLESLSPNGQWLISKLDTSSEKVDVIITQIDAPSKFYNLQVDNYNKIFLKRWSSNGESLGLSISPQKSNEQGCYLSDIIIFNLDKGTWKSTDIYPSSNYFPSSDCIFFSWSNDNNSILIFPRVPDKNGNIPVRVIDKFAHEINSFSINTNIPYLVNDYDSFRSSLNVTQIDNDIFISYHHEESTSAATDYYYFSTDNPNTVEHLFHFEGFCYLVGKDQNGKIYFSRILNLDDNQTIFAIYDLSTKKLINTFTEDLSLLPAKRALQYPIRDNFILESKDQIYFLNLKTLKLTNMGEIRDSVGWNSKYDGYLVVKEKQNRELYLFLIRP